MAKTAEDAVLFLGLTVPLFIIANYDFPHMTGLDLLIQARRDHRTHGVPLIIYIFNRSPEVQHAYEDVGCSAFLRHPYNLENLYATVEATLKRPRSFLRLTTALEVGVGDVSSPEGGRGDTITAISERWMFVNTAVPLSHGKILPLTFYLPNELGWPIRVEGQVLFSDFGENKRKIPGMAVKFLKIGDREREIIREYIRQELMKGIAPEQAIAGTAPSGRLAFLTRTAAAPSPALNPGASASLVAGSGVSERLDQIVLP
jgi:CheY-like chemotaxis protein